MKIDPSLAKRVKRQVTGRCRELFAATAPGLEALCLRELKALPLSTAVAQVVAGGVTFEGRLQDCMLANLHLRTASRILMRLDTFKASNFGHLEKKLGAFPWELFLQAGCEPQIRITTRRSRLYHKAAISGLCIESLRRRLGPDPEHQSPAGISQHPQCIFIRIEADRLTLSLDSSGELLYKRRLKSQGARAPLRESLAAAALMLAGYRPEEPLVDPFCGSGTFSLEAALMTRNTPPGWFRDFAFMGWPAFNPPRWNYLRKQAASRFTPAQGPSVYASDKDPAVCRMLSDRVSAAGLSTIITVANRDFLAFSPSELTDQRGLVAINPPYGVRIGTRRDSEILWTAIIAKLGRDYRNWKAALIVPPHLLRGAAPLQLETHALMHGGLPLKLLTGRIR